MHEVEIWINVVCCGNERYETFCTLFANHSLPIRPLVGETLSFMQEKGSALEFRLMWPIGVVRKTSVSVTVEEVSHYGVKSKGAVMFKTSLRCSEIPVFSEEDASIVCALMTTQAGFDIDPYGINKLVTGQDE